VSLERAEALAFAGRLDAASTELDRTTSSLDHAGHLQARWIGAYITASRGDFAKAEWAVRSLLRSRRTEVDLRARAAATLGSVLRQTGRHAEAASVERAAIVRGVAPAGRTHLLIGLVADAVGLADLRAVDRALKQVGPRPAGGWRARVRLAWVCCERELLAGRPEAAAAHARRGLAAAEKAGAKRHAAKSFLFLGAALTGAGEAAEARRALRRAHRIASRIGAAPIAAVAGEMLGRPGRGR